MKGWDHVPPHFLTLLEELERIESTHRDVMATPPGSPLEVHDGEGAAR